MHRIRIERDGAGDGDLALLLAEGELDAFAAPDITQAFEQVAHETRVIADLAAVSFLDSTALGCIVGLRRRVGEAEGELRIVLPAAPTVRIFEITGLEAVLDTYPTRAAALEA